MAALAGAHSAVVEKRSRRADVTPPDELARGRAPGTLGTGAPRTPRLRSGAGPARGACAGSRARPWPRYARSCPWPPPSLPMPSGLGAVEGLKLPMLSPSLHSVFRQRQAMETAAGANRKVTRGGGEGAGHVRRWGGFVRRRRGEKS